MNSSSFPPIHISSSPTLPSSSLPPSSSFPPPSSSDPISSSNPLPSSTDKPLSSSDPSPPSSTSSSSLHYFILLFYISIFIIFLLLFSFRPSFKLWILSKITSLSSSPFSLFLLGVVLTIVGFPLMPFELALGFLLPSFFQALLIDLSFKLVGISFVFWSARYLFRLRINNLLRENVYFKIIQRAISNNPLKTCLLVKFMWLPHIVKNWGLAVTEVSFLIFFLTTGMAGMFFGTLWLEIGRNMRSLEEAQGGAGTEVKIIKIGLIFFTLAGIGGVGWYSRSLFEEVKNEMENEKGLNNSRESNKTDYGTMKEIKKSGNEL